MKILFNHGSAFSLAHGGMQIQIEQTKSALESIGVQVEYVRWWDDSQRGDIIHYFGRPATGYVTSVRRKGIPIVIAPLLTGMGSRSKSALFCQRIFVSVCRRIFPPMVTAPFGWDSHRLADACVALTSWEAYLMSYVFGAVPEKVHVVPNGVEQVFLTGPHEERGRWLVCTATITERKRVFELAQAAVRAQTPLWIVGKPYSDTDAYAQRFVALARQNPKIIRYEGPIQDRNKMAQAYRGARGFVLLSTMESLSLSALEAAACECPLLLSDLPWARTTFKEAATYCPITSVGRTAVALRKFYEAAPDLKPPPRPLSWIQVAEQLKKVYERVLSTSR